MRYKVGDKVVIRDDLDIGTKYYVENRNESSMWVKGMSEFIGEQEISSISSFRYRIKADNQPEWVRFNFTDEMIDHKRPQS